MTAYADLPPALDAPRADLDTGSAGRIAYYSDTSAGGRPLVLVHSVNAAPSAFEMRPLFEHYRGRRPVYAPDLPGFGASDRSDRAYLPPLYADALAAFLEKVVAEPSDIIALSLGCEFAARTAAQAADRIRSLALLSPTGFGTRRPPSGATSDRLHRFFRTPALGDGLFTLVTSRRSIRYFLNLNFDGSPPAEMVDYAYATSHREGAKRAPFFFLSGKLFTPDAFESLYAPLSQPVLVVYDRDPNVSFDRLPEMLAAHPNWHEARIRPTRGLPHWERLPETIRSLESFWAETGGR